MSEYEESDDREIREVELLTETVAQLAATVQTQNDILLCLLHKFEPDHDLPFWITKEGMEKEITPKVEACIEAVRRAYGPSEADKS